MQSTLKLLRANRVGLALSGGSVRGLAHIGVIKVLNELEIKPVVVAGTSVGSIIGAAVAYIFNRVYHWRVTFQVNLLSTE